MFQNIVDEMVRGNFSFFILVVGIAQLVVGIAQLIVMIANMITKMRQDKEQK